ncbi:MAG: phosphotriesterase [Deltaproteobacteria bacterium]|nr:phosphotriesterase [Deltaproteobacteria bacterium]
MSQIMTVTGPIRPDELGVTSMHEHILYDGSIYHDRFAHLIPEDAPVRPEDKVTLENIGVLNRYAFFISKDACSMHEEDVMLDELSVFKASGGSAVVDLSAPGLRSDLPAIQRISKESGVLVIASTGLYTEDSWPERFKEMSVSDYEQYMLREIAEGIEDTGIRPGHIKIAIEDGPSEQGVKLLKAAARVSMETGISATIHQGTMMTVEEVRPIIDILLGEGMQPDRAVICHIQDFFVEYDLHKLVSSTDNWWLNTDFAKELMDKGLNVSIDCLGHSWTIEAINYINQTDWQRLAGVYKLAKEGYSGQMVLGTDTFIKTLTRRYGAEGFCRLTNFVIPTLREADLPEADIRKMAIENPARILAH